MKQEKDATYLSRQSEYIRDYLSKESHRIEAERLGLVDRLTAIQVQLKLTKSSGYLKSLEGTIGCDVSLSGDWNEISIALNEVAPEVGLEPTTYWLTANRSTIELLRNTKGRKK